MTDADELYETRIYTKHIKKQLADGTVRTYAVERTYKAKKGGARIRPLSPEETAGIRDDYLRGVPMVTIQKRYKIGLQRVKTVCAGLTRGCD